MPYSMKIEENL